MQTMEVGAFIYQYKQFAQDLYTSDNKAELNDRLQELNAAYKRIMDSTDITTMEKQFIFVRFTIFDEITMYIVPIIKQTSQILEKRYRRYHCIDSAEGTDLGPMD